MRPKKWKTRPLIKLGENIRTLRRGLGLTQESLAFKTGLHLTYIGGIERGERNPSVVNLFKIAEALEVAPAHLLDGITFESD